MSSTLQPANEGAKADPVVEAMKLPAGQTCDNCFAYAFCLGIGCTWSGRTECDYYPRRFQIREAP